MKFATGNRLQNLDLVMPKRRNHLHCSRSVNTVRRVPSTQLDIKQIERDLLTRDRRRRFDILVREGNVPRRTATKSNHASNQQKYCTSLSQTCLSRDRSCGNSRSVDSNRDVGIEHVHLRSNDIDITNLGLCDTKPLSQPNCSINDINLNAQYPGRSRAGNRRHQVGAGRVGRPRKQNRCTNYEVMRLPIKPVIKISPKRGSCLMRSRSGRSYSHSSSQSRGRNSRSGNRSGRVASISRYQVTPHPCKDEQLHGPLQSCLRSPRHRQTPCQSSSSENSTYNCSSGSEQRRHRHHLSNRGSVVSCGSSGTKCRCKCRLCKIRNYQQTVTQSGQHKKKSSYPHERPAGKRRHSSSAANKTKTIIERVTSAWSSAGDDKKRKKCKTSRSRRSSRSGNDRDKAKRHRPRESRSRGNSEKAEGGGLDKRLLVVTSYAG